jgi:hypothetical protein
MKAHQSHQSHCSHNSHFTDADFFRRLVAERADSMAPLPSMRHAIVYIQNAKTIAACYDNPSTNLDALIHIAALCERAAVDLTIPNSRVQKGRDRRSARSAFKKGKL